MITIEQIRECFKQIQGCTFVLTNLINKKGRDGYLTIFNVSNQDSFVEELNIALKDYFDDEEFGVSIDKGMKIDFESEKEYLWLADWTEGVVDCN